MKRSHSLCSCHRPQKNPGSVGFATPEVDRVVQPANDDDDDDEVTTSEEASSVTTAPRLPLPPGSGMQQELRISDMVSTSSEKDSAAESESNPNVNIEDINFDDEVMLYDTQL